MEIDSNNTSDSDQGPQPTKQHPDVTESSSSPDHSPSTPTVAPIASPSSPQLQHQNQLQQPPPPMTGPRPAPHYSIMNAIIDKKEDGPGSRCGHTLTSVAAVGEEGTSGYIGPRLILFGGATALEGSSAASPPSSVGSAGIRKPLLLSTNDCFFSYFSWLLNGFHRHQF